MFPRAMNKFVCFFLLLIFAISFCSKSNELSDRKILSFAKSSYEQREKMHTVEILGYQNGAKIIVEYPCSDLCPAYTKRIIHYDVDVENCAEVDGMVKKISVPFGIAFGPKEFCIPKVLENNWNEVVF
jgi:hypothetical protein